MHALDRVNLPEKLAPRHALLNVFHRAAAKRLAFVCAPAGYGKTISTLLWLNDSGRKGIWIQLNEQQNALADFYAKLGGGLVALQPYNRELQSILMRSDFGSSPVEFTQQLIASLARDEELYSLIIDDFHCVKNEEIHKSLPNILLSLPYAFSSFILSREEPSGSMQELLEKGRVEEITAEALAFEEAEIGVYFREHGRNLSGAEIRAVHTMTKGWPMGVNALALTGSISLGMGESQLIDCYLNEHAWERWPEDIRLFLMQCSIVDEITPDICARLTGREDSEAILRDFCAANMFIVDSGLGGYRCHHLFQDFLRAKLHAAQGIDAQRLYRIAAEFYMETGRYYEGLRFSVKGGNYAGVEACMLELYKYSTQGNAVAEHAARLKSYLMDLIPDVVLEENPYLLINYAWSHYLMGQAEPMLHYIDRIYENFETILSKHNIFMELGLLITTLDFRKSPMGILLEEKGANTASVNPGRQMQTVTMTENMPFYHRSNRDYSPFALNSDASFDAFSQAFGNILGPGILEICVTGLRGGLLYEQNRLEEAIPYADSAIQALLPETVAELKVCAMLLRAVICLAQDEQDEYEERLQEIKALLDRESAMYLMPNLLAVETKHRLMHASKGAAREWLARYFVTEPEMPEFYKIFQHFTTARAYIVLNRIEEALALLQKLKALGASFNRPLDVAEAGSLLALICWGIGEKQQSRAIMEETLQITQTYGFVRVVADEGSSVLPVLKDCLNALDAPGNRCGLDLAYVNNVYLAAYAASKKYRGLGWNIHVKPVKLSPQQTMILSMMAKGFKQKQIAEIASLALPTVKSHTYVMYKKLDVNNAADAILKARDMGLIE